MHKKQPASPNKKEADCFIGTCMYVKIRRYILRSCFEFLQKVFLGLMYPFFVCALGDFLVLFAPVLRQIARYLPHHRSENASKTHPKSSHDKFKTASYALSVDCLPCPDYNVIP